mmetsp:Transcript_19363/g.17170  ORF Transcript_19363/g.17170 Transcript_19363/m.17170 type:complete len:207 (-) Transcript_19363:140-760(-)
MSIQNASQQLLQVEKRQIELESQIKTYQSALSKLQGENWQKHFTKQLTSIKDQVGKMEQKLKDRKMENKKLKEERDSYQKQIEDLTVKLRESQKPKKSEDKQADKKPMVCGGQMNKEIDDNIRSIAEKIKPSVIERAKKDNQNVKFDEFTPIQAKSQVVAGVNWFLKIKTGKDKYINIKVWSKLDKTYELSAIQYNKTEKDELGYF